MQHPSRSRAADQRRRIAPLARLFRATILAAGTLQVLRFAGRVRLEIADFRASDAQLRPGWITIPGIAGRGSLRMRARIGDTARTDLAPIVLVPGYAVGSAYLVPLAGRLAAHAHVYAPDLPGHGRSDHDIRPLTIPELARALARWMDAAELRACLLVGHSIGCQVVAEVAAQRPELVAGVVLIGPTSDPAAPTSTQQLARGLASTLFDRPTYVAAGVLDYCRAGASVLAAEMLQMVSHRIEDVLPRVAVPARVVRGGRDQLVPQRWAETVASLVQAPEPTVVPGWGHAVHYDAPDATARVVLQLARQISR